MQPASGQSIVEMLGRYPFGGVAEPRPANLLVKLNRRFKPEQAEQLRGKVEFHAKLHHPSLVAIIKAFQSKQACFFDVFFQYVPKGLRQCSPTMTRSQLMLLKNQLRDLCTYLIGMNLYPEVAEQLIGVDALGNAKLYVDVDFRVLKPKQNKGQLIKVKFVEIEEVVGQYERQAVSAAQQHSKQPVGSLPAINSIQPIIITSRSQEPLIRFQYVSPPRARVSEASTVLTSTEPPSPRNEGSSRFIYTERKSHPLTHSEPVVGPPVRTVIQSVSPQGRSTAIHSTDTSRRISINPQALQRQDPISHAQQSKNQSVLIGHTSRVVTGQIQQREDSRQRFNSESRHVISERIKPIEHLSSSEAKVHSDAQKPPKEDVRNDTPIRKLEQIQQQQQLQQMQEMQQQMQLMQQQVKQLQDAQLALQAQSSKPATEVTDPKRTSSEPKEVATAKPPAEEKKPKKILKLFESESSPAVSQSGTPREQSRDRSAQHGKTARVQIVQPAIELMEPIEEQPKAQPEYHSKFSHGLPAIAKAISQSVMLNEDHLMDYALQQNEEPLRIIVTSPSREQSSKHEEASKQHHDSQKSKPLNEKHPSGKPQQSPLPTPQPVMVPPKPTIQSLLQQYQQPRQPPPPIVINIISPNEQENHRLMDFARSLTEHSLDTYYAELGEALQMPRIKLTELRQTTQSPPKLPVSQNKLKLHQSVGMNSGKALLDKRVEIAQQELEMHTPRLSTRHHESNPFKRKLNTLDRIPDEPESPHQMIKDSLRIRHDSNKSNSSDRRNCLYQMAQNYAGEKGGLVEPNRQPYEEDSQYGKADYRLVNMFPPPAQPNNALAKQLNNLFVDHHDGNECSLLNNDTDPQDTSRNKEEEEQVLYDEQLKLQEPHAESSNRQESYEVQQQPLPDEEQYDEQLEEQPEEQPIAQQEQYQHHQSAEDYQVHSNSRQYYSDEHPYQQQQANYVDQRRGGDQLVRFLKASDSTTQGDLQLQPVQYPRVKNDQINQRVMQALKKSEAMLDFFNKFKQRKQAEIAQESEQ